MNSDIQQDQQYKFWVNLAAYSAILTALLLVILKLFAWISTDSGALLASSTDSLLDLLASLLNAIILRFALAPADREHSFGHGKAESLAGLMQSAIVGVSAILLMINGVDRIISPRVIVNSDIGVWVSVVAIVMTFLLVAIQKIVIHRTQSLAIGADALHYQSDLLLNLGVLLTLVLSSADWPSVDGIFTCGVGVFLLIGASKIFWFSIQHLMDRQLPDEELNTIRDLVMNHQKALGVHDLRTRQAGPKRFIQFHLELNDQLNLIAAHTIGDEIEAKIITAFSPCEVIIHLDPTAVVSNTTMD